MKYTKRPVTVEAIQWTGFNPFDVIDFTGRANKFYTWFSDDTAWANHVRADRNVIKIFTREGVMEARPGDWIIRGVKGEVYPCAPDIFAETYDPVK